MDWGSKVIGSGFSLTAFYSLQMISPWTSIVLSVA